jgi:putative methyltransferase (TIGR04325 family)
MNESLPLFDQGTLENLVSIKNNDSDDVWLSSRWITRQREFLLSSLNGETPRPHSFRQLLKFINPPFNIVDFGGGSGWLFHSLLFSQIEIDSYINVESINLHDDCDLDHSNYLYMNPLEVKNYRWNFSSSVLYFNSVIQYFESDSFMFNLVNSINPRFVLIDDLTPSNTFEFFAYQKYYESRIPYRFVDNVALVGGMKEIGFKLMEKFPFGRVISPTFRYGFDIESDDFSIGETNSLIFERA